MNLSALLQGQPFRPPREWRMTTTVVCSSDKPNAPRLLSDQNAKTKAKNRAAVLAVIERKPSTGQEVADATGLARCTVHRILRELIDEGLATVFVRGRTQVFRKTVLTANGEVQRSRPDGRPAGT